jgi:hypothetical protein
MQSISLLTGCCFVFLLEGFGYIWLSDEVEVCGYEAVITIL